MSTDKMAASSGKKGKRKIEYTKPLDSVPKLYVNNTNATFSNFDLRLTFGQVADIQDDALAVEPQVVILMSPQHAKALSDLLLQQIKLFDEGQLK